MGASRLPLPLLASASCPCPWGAKWFHAACGTQEANSTEDLWSCETHAMQWEWVGHLLCGLIACSPQAIQKLGSPGLVYYHNQNWFEVRSFDFLIEKKPVVPYGSEDKLPKKNNWSSFGETLEIFQCFTIWNFLYSLSAMIWSVQEDPWWTSWSRGFPPSHPIHPPPSSINGSYQVVIDLAVLIFGRKAFSKRSV